jgi:hypothetical protein
MYTIEITLKANPLALSVQRKEKDGAETLYAELLTALKSGHPGLFELTCDKETAKRLAVVTSEIMAIQLSDKASSSSGLGNRPGFGLA